MSIKLKKIIAILLISVSFIIITSTVVTADRIDRTPFEVAVYFDQWAVRSRGFTPADTYLDYITTLTHAFFEIVPDVDTLDKIKAAHGSGWLNENVNTSLAGWGNNGDIPWTIRSSEPDVDFGAMITPQERFGFPSRVGDEPFYYKGHFAVYEEICELYPDLEVIISVGGWNRSGGFSMMAYTAETRKAFIDSCVDFLKKYPFLAGFDLDWEYPGSQRSGGGDDRGNELAGVVIDGLTSAQAQAADRANFTLLLKEMRAAFDAAFPDEHKFLGFCVGNGGSSNVEFNVVQDYVDRINIMNYDGSGSWSGNIGHHTSPQMVNSSVNTFQGNGTYYQGLDPTKINIGASTTGPTWTVVSRPRDNPPSGWTTLFDNTTSNGLANGGGEAQFQALKQGADLNLRNNNSANIANPGTTNELRILGAAINSTDNWVRSFLMNDFIELKEEDGWIRWHDYNPDLPLSNNNTGGFIYFNNNPDNEYYGWVSSYDSVQTIQQKADIVLNRNLGGVIFWSAAGESMNPDYALTKAFAEALDIPMNRKLLSKDIDAKLTNLDINQNELTITVISEYSDGSKKIDEEVFIVNKDSYGYYKVGNYYVRVNTKDNTQIVDMNFVDRATWYEGIPLNTSLISITGPEAVASGAGAEAVYTISAQRMPQVNAVELEFELNGDFLSGKDYIPNSVFSIIGNGNYGTDIFWKNTGSTWTGKVTLLDMSTAGISGDNDIIDLVFNVNEGVLGATEVKINYVKMSYGGQTVDTLIVKGAAGTLLEQWYSPYDLNKDGVIDLNDITYALQFLLAKAGDPNWNEAQAVDYDNSGEIGIEDLIVILTNYTIPYYS